MSLSLLRSWRAGAQRRLVAEAWLKEPMHPTERQRLGSWAGTGSLSFLEEEESLQLAELGLDPLFLLLIERDRLREQQIPADPGDHLERQVKKEGNGRFWGSLKSLKQGELLKGAAAEDLWKRALKLWRQLPPAISVVEITEEGEVPQRRAAADGSPPLLCLSFPLKTEGWSAEISLEATLEGPLYHLEARLTGQGVPPIAELGILRGERQLWIPLPSSFYLPLPETEQLRLLIRELP